MAEEKNNKVTKTNKEDSVGNVNNSKDKSSIVFYADSKDVNMIDAMDDEGYLAIDEKNYTKQSMDGFGDYDNIVDYIVKITRQIWKEKDIGLIYDTYSYGVQIHRGLVNSHGVNEVISGTLQTLQSFPDRSGLGYSVIWSGNDKDGFFTSHRGKSVGTNLGDTLYGPATGKKVMFRTTADCLIHNNKIYEEWLVMDTHHLVEQLGFDPVEVAKRTAQQTKALAPNLQFNISQSAEEGLQPEHYEPKNNTFEIGDFILLLFNQVWSRKSLNKIKEFYENNAVLHYVRNRDMVGHSEIQGTFLNLFSSVPNAKVLIDRVTCNKRGSDNDWDVAVRWRLQGIHGGIGYFGKASGKNIEINGVNHYKVRNQKIQEEWMLFDGLDVLRQVYTEREEEISENQSLNHFDDGNFTGVS